MSILCHKYHLRIVLLITDQKSGLKVSILSFVKATGKILIGYFLMQELDARSQVVEFLQVLQLYDEIFGDVRYGLNYQRSVSLRKPVNHPKDDDNKADGGVY